MLLKKTVFLPQLQLSIIIDTRQTRKNLTIKFKTIATSCKIFCMVKIPPHFFVFFFPFLLLSPRLFLLVFLFVSSFLFLLSLLALLSCFCFFFLSSFFSLISSFFSQFFSPRKRTCSQQCVRNP